MALRELQGRVAGVYEFETACISYEYETILHSLSLSLSLRSRRLSNKQKNSTEKKHGTSSPPFPDKENARYANFRLR